MATIPIAIVNTVRPAKMPDRKKDQMTVKWFNHVFIEERLRSFLWLMVGNLYTDVADEVLNSRRALLHSRAVRN
jgi:hypothetical protein